MTRLLISFLCVSLCALITESVDEDGKLKCYSAVCQGKARGICNHLKDDSNSEFDCSSCGEAFMRGPLGDEIALRTCQKDDLCTSDEWTQVRGPTVYTMVRCCRSDFCNNSTRPNVVENYQVPKFIGVSKMEVHEFESGGH